MKKFNKTVLTVILILIVALSACSNQNKEEEIQEYTEKINALTQENKGLRDEIAGLNEQIEKLTPGSTIKAFWEVSLDKNPDDRVYYYVFRIFQGRPILLNSNEELDIEQGRSYLIEYDENFNIISIEENN